MIWIERLLSQLPARNLLIVVIGTVVYSALLGLSYAAAPYADIPTWWRQSMPNERAVVLCWFTLLNLGGAVLAAVPVAFGVVFGAKTARTALALVVGVMPATYIVVGGLLEFGAPPSVDGWIVDVAQFFAVTLAVAAWVAPFRDFPLTIGRASG